MADSGRPWERWDDPGVADHIDQYWRNTRREIEHRGELVRLAVKSFKTGDRLLDVGCGSGLFYEHLKADFHARLKYTGVDTSHEMIEIARKRNPGVDFRLGDAFSLGFRENSFDYVLCFEVLGHLPEIITPLTEMFRASSKALIFTLWIGGSTVTGNEMCLGSKFIQKKYSNSDTLAAIEEATCRNCRVEDFSVTDTVRMYTVNKIR